MKSQALGESNRPQVAPLNNFSGIAKALADAVVRLPEEQRENYAYWCTRFSETAKLRRLSFGIGFVALSLTVSGKDVLIQLTPDQDADILNDSCKVNELIALAKKYKITTAQKMAVVQEIAKHFGIPNFEFECAEFRNRGADAICLQPEQFAEALFSGLESGFGADNCRTITFHQGLMEMTIKNDPNVYEFYLDVA